MEFIGIVLVVLALPIAAAGLVIRSVTNELGEDFAESLGAPVGRHRLLKHVDSSTKGRKR